MQLEIGQMTIVCYIINFHFSYCKNLLRVLSELDSEKKTPHRLVSGDLQNIWDSIFKLLLLLF